MRKYLLVKKTDDTQIQILVCCSIIDALAKCYLPEEDSNKIRFTKILADFGDSNIWTRVSVYNLLKGTKNDRIKENQELKNLFIGLPQDNTFDYTHDPLQKNLNNTLEEKEIEQYLYTMFFYKNYRCGLVHEYEIKNGLHLEYPDDKVPFYWNYDNNGVIYKSLVFPSNFILNTTDMVIDRLENWLIQTQLNPYERMGFI